MSGLRIISGGRWTIDGRWVVLGEWLGLERIVYDPGLLDPWGGLQACLRYRRRIESAGHRRPA